MITINDIDDRLKLHFNDQEDYKYIYENHHENFLKQFSDDLPCKYSKGGRYLMMECTTENTFQELLALATKIPGKEGMYEFTFGELATKKVSKTKEEEEEILKNAIIIGREFRFGEHEWGLEIEYEGKKYIHLQSGLVEITPIKWIIDVKNHKIKSENVITEDNYYSCYSIIKELKQPYPKKGIPYSIFNGFLIIEDGKIEQLKLDDRNLYLNIPSHIEEIDMDKGYKQEVPVKFKKITFPKTMKQVKISKNIGTDVLEMYDNLIIKPPFEFIIFEEYILHYSSFDNLFIFLNNKLENIKLRGATVHLYGEEELTKDQETIIKNYISKYVWHKEATKKEILPSKIKETITREKEQKEGPEKNELSTSLEKLYKILTYYEIGKEETRITKEEVLEYKQKLKDLEKRFYNGEENIESPEVLYNEFLERIKDKLDTYEKDTEYHKIIDLIDICEKAIKGDAKNINIELIGDLYNVSNVVLPYLKDSYHKYYKQAILDILSNEMKSISTYLNKREEKPKYTNTEEFIKYFITIFNPLLIEINLALNDESTKRNLVEEIMKVVTSNMSLEFKEARYGMITTNLEYLQELSNTLDEKIAISPFPEKYTQDKNNILVFAKNINKYYSDKSLREEIIASCSMLRKYLRKKPEEFIEIDKLVNDIIKNDGTDKTIRLYEQIINMQNKGYVSAVSKDTEPESIPFDENNSETHKIINALYEIIRTLQLLELEVDESIEKKKAFTRCKIID